MIYFVNNWDN